MIRIEYQMIAREPIHTGSNEKAGTMKLLRREKVILGSSIKVPSNFRDENERRRTIVVILEEIWRNIDFTDMSSTRKMGIWDEFTSKVLASTCVRTRCQFLNAICAGFDIRSIDVISTDIGTLIDRFSDDEFLSTIRDELQYLIILLRRKREESKKSAEDKSPQISLFNDDKTEETEHNLVFIKTSDNIPVISGNSIRGILRRIAMRDFCDSVGITKLDKSIYHQLFTGGNITDSNRYEDIDARENLIKKCPMLGLFGSAIGAGTIQGSMAVSHAQPICREHGNGDSSFWEYISTEFGTRRDDSKIEKSIEILVPHSIQDKSPNQMMYQYEVLITGTRLTHQLICTSSDPLIRSAFWRLLELFKEKPYIGGMSAVGNGRVDLSYQIEPGGSDMYKDYLDSNRDSNRDSIKDYFNP